MTSRGIASLTCLLAATSPSAASGFLLRHPSAIPATPDAAAAIDLPTISRRPLDSLSRRTCAGFSSSSRSPAALGAASSDAYQNPDDPPERSRRDVLRAALAVPAGALALSSSFPASKESAIGAAASSFSTPEGPKVTPLPSVRAALDLIDKSCDRRFLHAVVASDYNFLYRGLSSGGIDARSPTIRLEPCDLLDPATYGSDEAASYFCALDERMKSDGSPVFPSNGHLGVTCPKAAAEWGGVAASVWPLGGEDDDVHFAWFESGGEFWPRPAAAAAAESDNVIVDGIDCGRLSLDDALAGDRWEVLFRADRGFLAVPVAFEAELREGLRNSFLV